MTERLADVSARIDGIRQLGAVVNAMKGIAAARASTARAEIKAVDSYAATIAAAISNALGPASPASSAKTSGGQADGSTGLLVFCAEQGFAGAFSERILDSIEDRTVDRQPVSDRHPWPVDRRRARARSGLVRADVLAHARHPETGR